MSDHKVEDTTGRLKEAAGDITGDKELQREGKLDQASAATKKAIDDAADKIKDVDQPEGVGSRGHREITHVGIHQHRSDSGS